MSDRVHEYESRLEWSGSTAAGYESYDRNHRVTPAGRPAIELSSDAAFRGDGSVPSPEDLQLVAASSCQLLSFLAIAARARLDVVSYEDEARALMPEDDKPVRITRIVLRPRITVAGEVDEQRLRHLVEIAHEHCYIANSLKTEVVVEPRFEYA